MLVVGWGDEDCGLRVAAVAGAAANFVRGGRGLELGKEALIDFLVHAHHYAGAVFHGVGVGGKVEVAGGGGGVGVFGVAVFTVDAEFAFELVHDVDDLVAGVVLGEDLEVGGLGARTVGAGLVRRGGGRRGRSLGWGRECEGDAEEGGKRGKERAPEVLRHPWGPLERRWKRLRCGCFKFGIRDEVRRPRVSCVSRRLFYWA
jgi:hypothetical protein